MSHFRSPIAVAFALLTLISCTKAQREENIKSYKNRLEQAKSDCYSRGGYLYVENYHDSCIYKNPEMK